jgi:hypothetical protein
MRKRCSPRGDSVRLVVILDRKCLGERGQSEAGEFSAEAVVMKASDYTSTWMASEWQADGRAEGASQ